jgi:membrane protein insertase Oxa1/YidC/SpoIIIJ
MERHKMKLQRKQHGIYPFISMFNIFQPPVHLVYISMINRLAFNYEINPAILNEGFFWFTDLSSPDPTGILPVLGGLVSLLNLLTTSTTNTSTFMRKIKRYIYIFPLISIPVWMTFPVVSILKVANHFIGIQFVLVDHIKCLAGTFKFVQV